MSGVQKSIAILEFQSSLFAQRTFIICLQSSKLGDKHMEQQLGLNAAGVVFIVAAWGFILATTIFCFKRVLGSQGQKK